jgi:hypothetical protein
MLALAAPLHASGSDFWNKKPPSDWMPEEIERLLKNSPWAKEITPTYTSVPPRTDRRVWSENPPIGRGPIPWNRRPKISVKVPYHAIILWESADPIRSSKKIGLPPAFADHYVIGIFFLNAAHQDLGSKPIENLRESAVLLSNRPVDATIVQGYPGTPDGFLVGFPKTSMNGVRHFEVSARVGLLALKAKFDAGEMRYHGQLAL